MQLGQPAHEHIHWWGLFNRIWMMAAGANLLWTLLPNLLAFLPEYQTPSNSAQNVTQIFPISDLIHTPFSEERRLQFLQDTKRMFYWGYDNYMTHAFPFDELNPVNCTGRGHDWIDKSNVNVNDALGDYSLTLVDTLDTLAIMGNASEFMRAVQLTVDNVSFSGPCTTVQVFEATIRILGSLLSAHLLIKDSDKPFGILTPTGYTNELLSLANDLGARLLPAFENSATGLPHPRVNLCYGVPEGELMETCTAGAGTLTLEFTLLSRLLGDPVYENAARRAVRSLWDHRHRHTGLVGNVINIQTGHWAGRMGGLGAGIDSYYEYLLKSNILFGEREDLEMFYEMYASIMKYLRRGSRCQDAFRDVGTGGSPIFVNVDYASGKQLNYWMDSLSASFAGLQVLAGDLEEAICTHALHYSIWRRYEALPERFDWHQKSPNVRFYPLRPELVESTYFLYQATQNPFYLHVGGHILESLNRHTKARCGYTTLHDVVSKTQEDRMESFFLSETCKYLYLLFDTDNEVNKKSLKYIFTTEGHLIKLDPFLRHNVWEQFKFPRHAANDCYGRCDEERAVAKTDQSFVSHSCTPHSALRKYALPLSRERLGEIEAMVGLYGNQQTEPT